VLAKGVHCKLMTYLVSQWPAKGRSAGRVAAVESRGQPITGPFLAAAGLARLRPTDGLGDVTYWRLGTGTVTVQAGTA
jgi:hypothetical protein